MPTTTSARRFAAALAAVVAVAVTGCGTDPVELPAPDPSADTIATAGGYDDTTCDHLIGVWLSASPDVIGQAAPSERPALVAQLYDTANTADGDLAEHYTVLAETTAGYVDGLTRSGWEPASDLEPDANQRAALVELERAFDTDAFRAADDTIAATLEQRCGD